MSQPYMPVMKVGNEFLTAKPKLPKMKVEVTTPEASLPPQKLVVAVASGPTMMPATADMPDLTLDDLHDLDNFIETPADTDHSFRPAHLAYQTLDLTRRYRVASAAMVILLFGAAIIVLAGRYWSATYTAQHASLAATITPAHSVAGLNITVPAAELQAKLQTITSQKATLTVGPYSEQLSSDIIKSWLQISANSQHSEYFIHLDESAMNSALAKEASQYARTPVNQVTVNEDGASVVAVAGQDGRSLSDPSSLKTQAQGAAKNVLAASGGLQFNTPLQTTPFQAVTPANFDKLLVSNVNTKKLWAYQNGQLVNTFLSSDGKPDDPTPLGEFHIRAKLTKQTMTGPGYVQPNVPWINYFDNSGDAIHGVYWRPASVFGNVNTSHGCVGLPVDQAEWVYNWAPIGTTVIINA
jgi:lipoprotein-anchoring transpeptidase ErfK/SrfK